MSKYFFRLIACIVFFAGCAKLQHLDQLLTLQDMSKEGDRMDAHAREQDAKFDRLVKAVKDGSLDQGTSKKRAVKLFGDPVLIEAVERNGNNEEQWLYRRAKEFFGGEKVYLYFDAGDRLADWLYVPAREPS